MYSWAVSHLTLPLFARTQNSRREWTAVRGAKKKYKFVVDGSRIILDGETTKIMINCESLNSFLSSLFLFSSLASPQWTLKFFQFFVEGSFSWLSCVSCRNPSRIFFSIFTQLTPRIDKHFNILASFQQIKKSLFFCWWIFAFFVAFCAQ